MYVQSTAKNDSPVKLEPAWNVDSVEIPVLPISRFPGMLTTTGSVPEEESIVPCAGVLSESTPELSDKIS